MNRADEDRSSLIAATFAEVGEWETARRYAPPPRAGRLSAWIERHLLAAALAEEGLHADARRLLAAEPEDAPPREEDGLDALLRERGVRMCFGVLSPAALGARR